MTPLEQVEEALSHLREVQKEINACYARDAEGNPIHPLSVAHREDMQARWRDCFPKRKFNWEKAREEFPDREDHWKRKGQVFIQEQQERREQVEIRLFELCQNLPVPTTTTEKEEWLQIDETSGSTYASQGMGADKYAFQAAMLRVMKAEYYGLKAEGRVLRFQRGADVMGHPWSSTHYGVFANTTPTGAEILLRKPPLPLRDMVKACWAGGCQPRVFWAWLPPGFEEAEGLDFFGGELKRGE